MNLRLCVSVRSCDPLTDRQLSSESQAIVQGSGLGSFGHRAGDEAVVGYLRRHRHRERFASLRSASFSCGRLYANLLGL